MDKVFILRKAPDPQWSRGRRAFYWAWRILLMLGASTIFGMLLTRLACGPYPGEIFWGYLQDTTLLFFNVLPVVVLCFLFYGIFGRAWAGFLAGGGISLVMSLVNFFKLQFRDDPFIFEDILLVKEATKMTSGGHYALFVNKAILVVAGGFVLAAVLLALLARGRVKGAKWRLSLLLGAVLAGAALIPGLKSQKLYDKVENYEYLNRWSPTQNYVAHGFFYPFIHSVWDFIQTPPDGYSEKRAEELLAPYEDADIPEGKKVSVIAYMREAYMDFSRFGIEGLDASGYDLYHALEEESISGDLLTNIFGGGTIDSERCFLTGNYKLKDFRSNANSYLWYFREQGYTVEGIHPYYQWFYNRQNVNSYLGFERYRFKEGDFDQLTKAEMPEDSVMLEERYKDFQKNKETGKPYFAYDLNVQSHGPYGESSYGGAVEYLTGDYSEGCRNAMNNYMASIMNSDVELKKFLDKLRYDEEPVVLITWGDHLPWMGDGGKYYEEMGVDIDPATEEGFRRHYSTRYLIWANEAAKEILGNDFVGEGPTLSPCHLMGYLFDQCGWDGPAFMQAMEPMREAMPVVTTHDFCVIDGVFTNEVPEERQQMMEDFLILQHYWRNEFLYGE